MNIRFGVKRIAANNFKVTSCIYLCSNDKIIFFVAPQAIQSLLYDNVDSKRLSMFADISGIPTKTNPYRQYSAQRCKFFFQVLCTLFPVPAKYISTALNTKVL